MSQKRTLRKTKINKIEKEAKLEEKISEEQISEEKENPPKRRSSRLTRNTRSMEEDAGTTPSPLKLEAKKTLPFIDYRGEIQYFTDSSDIAATSDRIMTWVETQADVEVVPIAFDMEWPFSFQTGPGKSAVIQVCALEKCCYVFQIADLVRLPLALMALLEHPKVRLHGVNIKNDFRKLARDFPDVNADLLIGKCVDLGLWCNEVCETKGRWSLERLTNFIAEQAIDKNKKVRMSKWHIKPLDMNQLTYAAIDVYISQVIYRELEKREKIKQKNEEEFKLKNGEKAFKLVKALGENFLEETDQNIS